MMSYSNASFADAGRTDQVVPSPSSGTATAYSVPTATAPMPVTVAEEQTPESPEAQALSAWLSSDAAAPFEGQWVMLDTALQVVDSDLSPGVLLSRHPTEVAPRVVFVPPSNQRLAV